MKNAITFLSMFISLIGFSQNKETSKIELVGVWTLINYNKPVKFEDTWEFTSSNIFNELKFKNDGDRILVPDENGSWILEGNKLTITVTGEDTNGKQILFEKPQILVFDIYKENDDIILIEKRKADNGETIKLRLTNKL